ncbi:hypothetical protein cyc_00871 [Cyclospora cayetanensis]|uniref:Uncharacterized protein n=1 Tax=Cyclospora cayetanensis TaxID=88456 RepID=A0A1D3CVC0_9EIME|nr:hypothetical protein cyc_00871 [Cyclospora cayetanensis]
MINTGSTVVRNAVLYLVICMLLEFNDCSPSSASDLAGEAYLESGFSGTLQQQMDYATDKGESTRHVCICEICLLHPHLKAALRRMQPPELRLYSQNELLNLLECDVSMASENSEKHKIGSEESWWHLCTADRSFPIYIIPTGIGRSPDAENSAAAPPRTFPDHEHYAGPTAAATSARAILSILELGGAMPQQHHSCPCQVQEYILIGHPEGGLVGRPLETWGLNCPDADLLPLGVDYEACQDQAQAGGSSSISPASETHSREAASAVTSDENNDGVGIRKRRKTRTDDSTLDHVEWQPANNFKSILPDVPSRGKGAPKDAFGNDSDCEADSDSSLLDVHHSAREFGGMHLLPLSKRPYYREGFVRLPPLPTKSDKVAAKVAGATDLSQLEALQGVQSLSRFDSLLSLRAGFPSVSRVIVFRRTSKRGELG